MMKHGRFQLNDDSVKTVSLLTTQDDVNATFYFHNEGPDRVFILSSDSDDGYSGLPVDSGEKFSVQTDDGQVFLVCRTATSVNVVTVYYLATGR